MVALESMMSAQVSEQIVLGSGIMNNYTLLEFITDLQRLPSSQAFVTCPIPMTADSGEKSDCYAKVMSREVRKFDKSRRSHFL